LTPRLASRITASPLPIAPEKPAIGVITWPRRASSWRIASETEGGSGVVSVILEREVLHDVEQGGATALAVCPRASC
jgi:hypothetical protein